ncbi:hypothetical protein [Acinetobacter nosocomialis]|uniref:hypothetical protein n=1 Tax=Acinetobacter nosocomialis TaxID=106654 RepID=UPI002341EBC0|nr:hypothetical protein [Acinetobacter nosocomialis]
MAYIDKLAEVTLGKNTYKKFPVILNIHHILNRLVLKYFLSHRIVWSENTLHTYSKLICAELAGDFHLGYARQLTDKSSLLFDLAF